MRSRKTLILIGLLCLELSGSGSITSRNPIQQTRYQVYALRLASVKHPMPISDWVDKGPKDDSVKIDFMIWLIRGTDGKNILLDAGFQRGLEDEKEFDLVNYARPDSVLGKLDLKASDITDIIISHPHWDHIDGVSLFPNAHIWIQKDDYGYFVGGAWQKGGFSGGFNKKDVHTLLDMNMAGRVTLVDGDNKTIFPGITVFTGSRHTFNSQYALVETGKNKIILASDNIWIYYNLEHMRPASYGGTFDSTGYVNAMRRMKTMIPNTGFIIPGHDAKIFSIFPTVAEGVVKID